MSNPYYIPRTNPTAAALNALSQSIKEYMAAKKIKDTEERQARERKILLDIQEAQEARAAQQQGWEKTRFGEEQSKIYEANILAQLGITPETLGITEATGREPTISPLPSGPLAERALAYKNKPLEGMTPEMATAARQRAVARLGEVRQGIPAARERYRAAQEAERETKRLRSAQITGAELDVKYRPLQEEREIAGEAREVEAVVERKAAAAATAEKREQERAEKAAEKASRVQMVATLTPTFEAAYGDDLAAQGVMRLGLQKYIDTGELPQLSFPSGVERIKNALVAMVDVGKMPPKEALRAANDILGITTPKTKSDELDELLAAFEKNKGLYPPGEQKKREAIMVANFLGMAYTPQEDVAAEISRYAEDLVASGMDSDLVDAAVSGARMKALTGDATLSRQLVELRLVRELFSRLHQTTDPNERASIQGQINQMIPGVEDVVIGVSAPTAAGYRQVNAAWEQLATQMYPYMPTTINVVTGFGMGKFKSWLLPGKMGQDVAGDPKRKMRDVFVEAAVEIAKNTLGDTQEGRQFLRGVWAVSDMDEKSFGEAVTKYGYPAYYPATRSAPATQGIAKQSQMVTAEELGMGMTRIRAATTLAELEAALEQFSDNAPASEIEKAAKLGEEVRTRIRRTGGQAPLAPGTNITPSPGPIQQGSVGMGAAVEGPQLAQVPKFTEQQMADMKLVTPRMRRTVLERLFGPGHEADIERTMRYYSWGA